MVEYSVSLDVISSEAHLKDLTAQLGAQAFGWNSGSLVDKCSGAYTAGEWTGIAASTLAGGAQGWRAAGTKGLGREFSHWIPDRILKRTGSKFIRYTFGKSRLNGNYVTPLRHYLQDAYRYVNPRPLNRFPKIIQQLDRVPRVYYGAGAGGAVGGAAASEGDECGCR